MTSLRPTKKKGADGKLILLKENFRSHVEVLEATNHVFERLMDEEVGEILYDQSHRLIGAIQRRRSQRLPMRRSSCSMMAVRKWMKQVKTRSKKGIVYPQVKSFLSSRRSSASTMKRGTFQGYDAFNGFSDPERQGSFSL